MNATEIEIKHQPEAIMRTGHLMIVHIIEKRRKRDSEKYEHISIIKLIIDKISCGN